MDNELDLRSEIAALRAELTSEPVIKIGDGSPESPERTIPVREAISCLAENYAALEERVRLMENRIGETDTKFGDIARTLHAATMTARALVSQKTPPRDVN